jgi:uncharacterized protein YggE
MLKILLFPVLLACVATLANASQLPDYPFIHAIGSAKVYIQPDIGEINFEVTFSDPDSEKATQQCSIINDNILKILADQNIPASDITIYELEKKVRTIDLADGKAPTVIYEIKQGMQIEVRDLSKWEGLTTPLLAEDHLGNFDTTFDRTDRQELKDGLMQEAIKNAQHNGTIMAEALGKHLGAVTAMSSEKLRDVGFAFGLSKGDFFDSDERRSQAIRHFSAPQAIMIMQSVDVLYKIK